MKESTTKYWKSPNTGATNISGFTALPGGSRGLYGGFYNLTEAGYWWSATESFTWAAPLIILMYEEDVLYQNTYNAYMGLSIRCLKN